MDEDAAVGREQQFRDQGFAVGVAGGVSMSGHGIKLSSYARAIFSAWLVSTVETVRRSSPWLFECHAGQKPDCKWTFTPGKFSASHRAMGRQQQSLWPGIIRWRTMRS